MAVPRPVIIAVLGVTLIAGAFLLMRGSQSSSTVTPAPVAQSTPAKPAPRPATTRPAAPAKPHPAAPAKPAVDPADAAIQPVVNALSAGKVVVLYFSGVAQGKPSADDVATGLAVRSVAGMKQVSVFVTGLDQLSTYRRLLSGVAVSQVPAVVVMRSGGAARLIEGYVDPGTLRQTVADEQG
jgi:hypothetical protein